MPPWPWWTGSGRAVDLGKRIRELAELMAETGISELEVRHGDEAVRIVRPLTAAAAPVVHDGAVPAAAESPAEVLRAPMAGTFYAAPEPGAEPFVQPGDRVETGDVVCIIESMKMLNEIRSDVSGVCVAVVASNGQPVGRGDPLFRIAP